MRKREMINGFSKLDRHQKIDKVVHHYAEEQQIKAEFESYRHPDSRVQKLFDEFSENTLTNFFMPFGIAPNVLINGKLYHVPMVIEESSVVAAASNSAKFWSTRGGFKAKVKSMHKIGQVHFIWDGDGAKLHYLMPEIKERLIKKTALITSNMRARGGGILDIVLVDMTHELDHYYQIKATFDTRDSMGANFINTCLEEFAAELRQFFLECKHFTDTERDIQIIMSILSNYTPECVVECSVECPIEDLAGVDETLTPMEFAQKFEKAIRIAQIDIHRATTHNKGIFNGIDAVALATGQDFRAIEACGHTYASRSGKYASLTDISLENGIFKYTLTVALAVGTIGGLTALHPLAKRSLQLLDHPNAEQLMIILATIGLANNFGAVKSLITKGIQVGHMKMHLLNILNHFGATQTEKEAAVEHFKTHKVSFSGVEEFLICIREKEVPNTL